MTARMFSFSRPFSRRFARLGPLLLLLGLLQAACASQKERSISALHHFNKGNEAFYIEDYSGAIEHYRQALTWDETAAEVHYNLGLAYYKVDDHDQAVGAFNAALELNPGMADAHFNLALTYDKLFQPSPAHEHYNLYRKLAAGNRKAEEKERAGAGAGPGAGGNDRGRARAGRGKGTAAKPGAPGRNGGGAAPRRVTRRQGHPITGRQPIAGTRGQTGAGARAAHGPQRGANPGDSDKWWIQDRFTRKQ